jgi:hypothetical protein
MACAVALGLSLGHCAQPPLKHGALAGAPSLGVPLSPEQSVVARQRMAAARPGIDQASATLTTRRFGPEGRLRVILQLVLRRPNQFRITVLGPHGPPVYAVACDGAQLTALDVAAKSYSAQPATPAGIAHHLGGLDLGLTAQEWVDLFLGTLAVPEDAWASRPSADDKAPITWRWTAGARQMAAQFDGPSGQLLRASMILPDGREGTVTLKGRSSWGLVEQLQVHLGPSAKEAAQDVDMSLSDGQLLPASLEDGAFRLDAPAVPSL